MAAGIAGYREAANAARRRRLDRGGLSRRRAGLGGSHLVRHLRHDGAEADHEGGKDHDVTHYATLG